MKIDLSYNPNTVNKSNIKNNGYKFVNINTTPYEIYNFLVNNGYSICVSKLNGDSKYKKMKPQNFISSQIIVIDIDNNNLSNYISYDSIINNEFINKYASFIYTTHNHTDSHHRYRIFFILDQKITDCNIYKELINKLISKFNSDKKTSSIVQMFFGNTECKTNIFWGNILPVSLIKNIKPPQKNKYIYDSDIKKENINHIVDDNTVILYTDGSYSIKTGTGGYGFIVLYRGMEYKNSGAFKNSTSQRMELIAIQHGLSFIYKSIYHKLNKNINITIFTDSNYSNNVINNIIPKYKDVKVNKTKVHKKPYILGYKNKNIFEIKKMMDKGNIQSKKKDTGKDAYKNLDLIDDINTYYKILPIKSIWIKRKNGNEYNNLCDNMAKKSHENINYDTIPIDIKKSQDNHH